MEMTLQGVRVHYEISGHGERKVVLLHGWGCSEKLMAGISDALTPDMTVLRVDFPAHGESGFPPQPWGVPDFAANLLELLTKLDFLPCSVIAHSFGGRVTIELAADHPERFEKLILTGAAGIRPKLSSEKSKKSQRYQRLKKLVGVAKKTHLFGSLPDKWQENLVQMKINRKLWNKLMRPILCRSQCHHSQRIIHFLISSSIARYCIRITICITRQIKIFISFNHLFSCITSQCRGQNRRQIKSRSQN